MNEMDDRMCQVAVRCRQKSSCDCVQKLARSRAAVSPRTVLKYESKATEGVHPELFNFPPSDGARG